MDPKTHAGMTLYRPSLEGALCLLREAEALQPSTTAGFEKLLAARCELEQVLGLANEVVKVQQATEQVLAQVVADEAVKGDAAARQVRELLHLGTSARLVAQRALKADGTATADAAVWLKEIVRLHATGVCGCPVGMCEFAVKKAPLRKAAILVKGPPKLSIVKDPTGGAA
jgi:hypothetical protein